MTLLMIYHLAHQSMRPDKYSLSGNRKKPLWVPLLLDFVEFCCLETLVKSAQIWTYFGNSNRQH